MGTTAERTAHWERVYRERGDDDVSWFQQQPEPSLGLILTHREEACLGVIDIGAGASRLADALLAAGISDITLLDISQPALDKTAARLGERASGIDFVAGDITRWHPARHWGVWHDRAVFHFLVSAGDQDAYLNALNAATLHGSIVVMGTFAPDGPEKCSGLPVQRYSAQSLGDRLGPQYELVETINHTHETPFDSTQKFMFALFRKA